MKAVAKGIRIQGNDEKEIADTFDMLQNFLDSTALADVQKLLNAVNKKPSILKTALKWI